MAENRSTRIKTREKCLRTTYEVGGPSPAPPGRTTKKRDPFFSPELQATQMSQFQGRKLAYVRYADISWLVEQGFHFHHELETQGANPFTELYVTYESCLRDTVILTPGGLTKVGALTIENRLLHYIMAYILVQRSTNHA
ncbi:hypothetical protein Lal_00024452 [Lupinus albus]|nr:hypothetical protein Lal_00024452 [Lupinus albus]